MVSCLPHWYPQAPSTARCGVQRASAGSCKLFKSTAITTLEGVCNNVIPQSVAQFNGASSYVNAGNGAGLDAYPITVVAWIQTTSSGVNGGIVNKYLSSSMNGYQIFLSGGMVYAWYFKDGSDYIRTDTLGNGPIVNDGNWHQIVYVVSSAGEYLYVDGSLKKSGA